ncbi:MAG: hypothetical protein GXP31_07605 [Kiritimatiellaeota bacterium]|nr:hypothetical protein [Kiritimatiellota bacterium]
MCARFLNEQLITRPGFAPGGGDAEGADEGPMTDAKTSPESGAAAVGLTERGSRTAVLKREAAELERLRRDVAKQYDRLRAELNEERSRLEACSAGLERIKQELSAVPAAPPDPGNDAAALGSYRRAVEGARIELLKLETELTPPHRSAPAPSFLPEIASLTLGQLTRIGFGLTWPLIAAIILGGAGVVLVLLALFAL